MTIKDRFPDNLISSTNLDARLVPGLEQVAQKGPIVAAVGLDKIVDRVTVDLASAPDNASHARPSMFASISSFADNVKKCFNAIDRSQPPTVYAALDKTVKQDFAEWQGMIAAVALNNIYSGSGLNLTIKPVRLEGRQIAGRFNQLHRCILMEMAKDLNYRDAVTAYDNMGNPLEGYLFYVCQNGRPFALFHPEIGLCAMKEYDKAIFEGVLSWYKTGALDSHKAWTPIMEHNGTTVLDDFCLCRIAWWAEQNGMIQYRDFIRSRQSNPYYVPAEYLRSATVMENATNIDQLWAGKGTSFGTSMMFFRGANGRNYALPELFMDRMLITYVGDQNQNKLIYNSRRGTKPICFKDAPAELREFAPVAPFRREMVQLLQTSTLENLTFEAKMEAASLRSITVGVTICTVDNELFTMHKEYDAANIYQGKLPYLMIWPFLPMPEMPDGSKLWKNYYATWQDQAKSVSLMTDGEGSVLTTVSTLTFDFQDQGNTELLQRPTANQFWNVCTGEDPFHYALLKGKVDEDDRILMDMGIIFVPEYSTYDASDLSKVAVVNNDPVRLAIDFGTTSTVAALRTNHLNGGDVIPLPFKDYSCVITCDDKIAKETVDIEHWLGNTAGGPDWKWDQKIFSVAQLFERVNGGGPSRRKLNETGDQNYYVDGRMFLVSGKAMSNYANSAKASADPLLAQQIMNDMKFNESLDIKNYQAASVYLAGVYMYAVLYLLSEKVVPGKAPYIELCASYPNAVTLNALRRSWNYAKDIADKVMDGRLTRPISNLLSGNSHFYNEATATTAYQRRLNSPINFVQSLVSLDIGGGTTDISITHTQHRDRVENLSLRYAGRDIMVSTLIEYFRRFNANSDITLDSSFSNIWANKEGTLLTQFSELCQHNSKKLTEEFLLGLTANSSVRMNVELLLSEGMKLEKVDIADHTNLLRQLIALKFIMVLMVTARTVRENIDMWKSPHTGELNMLNGRLEINLSVSGTSAQLLQYVFDCSMQDLNCLHGSVFDPKMKSCMELFNMIFTDALRDVLKEGEATQLKIYIDDNVREKREVCYGMLETSIDQYARAAAAKASSATSMLDMDDLSQFMQDAAQTQEMSDSERQERIEEMRQFLSFFDQQKLHQFLEGNKNAEGKTTNRGLLHYICIYEKIFCMQSVKMNRGLGERVQNISDLLKNFDYSTGTFTQGRMAMAGSRAAYMIEKEQEVYRDLLASMYLVDEILDREMARKQLY